MTNITTATTTTTFVQNGTEIDLNDVSEYSVNCSDCCPHSKAISEDREIERITARLIDDIEEMNNFINVFESLLYKDWDMSIDTLFKLGCKLRYENEYSDEADYMIKKASDLKHPDAMYIHSFKLCLRAKNLKEVEAAKVLFDEAISLGVSDDSEYAELFKQRIDLIGN